MSCSTAWRRGLPGGVLLLVLSLPATAELTVERVPGKLGQQHSSWSEVSVPTTQWRDATTPTTLRGGSPQSTFAPTAVPRSEFSLADVPQARLAETRRLLGELNARPDSGGAIVVDLPGDVLFDFDKHDLRADALPVLDRIAVLLVDFPTRSVVVNGHTDSKGDDAYNDALSMRRAESVYRYLADRDKAKARTFKVHGFGERQPVAPNTHADGSDDPEGRQKNRRVEIVFRAAGS